MRRRTFIGGSVGLFGAASVWVCARSGDGPGPRPLTLQAELSATALAAGEAQTMWAIVRIGTRPIDRAQRPPINVGLVIDTSSSMEGEAIVAARTAAVELVGTLRDGDRLSVVTFDSRAQLVVPAIEIDDDTRAEALEAIEAIVARGTTDLAAGLCTALDDLEPMASGGRVTRLVLLSDGVPNDASTVGWLGERARAAQITITSLGLGLDYDEVLLDALARATGGTFTYVEDATALAAAFAAQTERLQGVLAKDLQLSLVPGPKCTLLQVDSVAVAAHQREWLIALGDLSVGEERVIAVELSVAAHRAGTTAELLDASLLCADPATGEHDPEPCLAFVSAPVTGDRAVLAQAVLPEIERDVARARAAALTLRALEATRDGDAQAGKQILDAALPMAASSAERFDDDNLAEQSANMAALAEELEAELVTPEPALVDQGAKPAPKVPVARGHAARRAHSAAVQNFQARRHER